MDGIINSSDYQYIQYVLVDLFTPTNIQWYLGNINGDDHLDIIDAILLQQML